MAFVGRRDPFPAHLPKMNLIIVPPTPPTVTLLVTARHGSGDTAARTGSGDTTTRKGTGDTTKRGGGIA